MKSDRFTLAATALRFVRLLAFCIPTMMLLNAGSANEPPTAGASKIPGAKGTIEYNLKAGRARVLPHIGRIATGSNREWQDVMWK